MAQLAGLPRAVVQRAGEVLLNLEEKRQGKGKIKEAASPQLPLFVDNAASSAIVDELKQIDVDSMRPIDALNKLYELKKKAQELQDDGGEK